MDAFDPRSGVLLKADCFPGVDDGNLPFILVSVFFLQKPDHESYAILIRLIADNFGPISKRQMKVPETDSKKNSLPTESASLFQERRLTEGTPGFRQAGFRHGSRRSLRLGMSCYRVCKKNLDHDQGKADI